MLSFLSGHVQKKLVCHAKKSDDESSKKNSKTKEKADLQDYPVPNWEGIERKVRDTHVSISSESA
jgi:hypothetical protein